MKNEGHEDKICRSSRISHNGDRPLVGRTLPDDAHQRAYADIRKGIPSASRSDVDYACGPDAFCSAQPPVPAFTAAGLTDPRCCSAWRCSGLHLPCDCARRISRSKPLPNFGIMRAGDLAIYCFPNMMPCRRRLRSLQDRACPNDLEVAQSLSRRRSLRRLSGPLDRARLKRTMEQGRLISRNLRRPCRKTVSASA
jgi:hypothetical protein